GGKSHDGCAHAFAVADTENRECALPSRDAEEREVAAFETHDGFQISDSHFAEFLVGEVVSGGVFFSAVEAGQEAVAFGSAAGENPIAPYHAQHGHSLIRDAEEAKTIPRLFHLIF